MHLEFKAILVAALTKEHFSRGSEPYTETLYEILREHAELTGAWAIMYKRKIYYPEMVTDTEKVHEYSREMKAPSTDTVPKLEEFDKSIKVFNNDRKKFYAFMRKIVNRCQTIVDMFNLIPSEYHGSIQATRDLLQDTMDYPSLSPEQIEEFKSDNADSYKFLQEQAIWDNLLG